MFLKPCAFSVAILLLSLRTASGTVIVQYNLTNLGGNTYRYNYSVHNDGSLGAGAPIPLFDILFDPALYNESSMSIVTPDPPRSQWSEIILHSIPGAIPVGYDVRAQAPNSGVPDGGTASGFAVEFTWLGTGLPESQPFEIYDPDNISTVLQRGNTGAAIPEPCTGLAAGILLLWYLRRARLQRV